MLHTVFSPLPRAWFSDGGRHPRHGVPRSCAQLTVTKPEHRSRGSKLSQAPRAQEISFLRWGEVIYPRIPPFAEMMACEDIEAHLSSTIWDSLIEIELSFLAGATEGGTSPCLTSCRNISSVCEHSLRTEASHSSLANTPCSPLFMYLTFI